MAGLLRVGGGWGFVCHPKREGRGRDFGNDYRLGFGENQIKLWI